VVVDRDSAAARLRRRPGGALVAFAILIGLAVGVGIDVLQVGGLDAWLAARGPHSAGGAPPPPYEARGRVVAVDGREVYLDCRGAGSPTVILEAGFGSGAGSWGTVLDGVAAFTRVCAWDRPGLGRSAPRGLHSGAQTASDLRSALDEAGERGPFVVVGHSLGGVYARLFAASARPDGSRGGSSVGADAVVAFVMIDTYEPDLGMDVDLALSEEDRLQIRQSIDGTGAMIQNGEQLDWAATMAELAVLGPVRLPAVTLWVDQRGRFHRPEPDRTTALIDAWRRAVAARYPNGSLEIVPNAGHLIHLDQPALVIDRIRSTVLAHRGE
jgi:pimeloyl-ACP methyl ester carboxylesterase